MFIWFYIIHLLQIDVDIGSSTVANGVLGLVVGVITTLVVDMAFLVQVRFFLLTISSQLQFGQRRLPAEVIYIVTFHTFEQAMNFN